MLKLLIVAFGLIQIGELFFLFYLTLGGLSNILYYFS
jgi:hypothetical protein